MSKDRVQILLHNNKVARKKANEYARKINLAFKRNMSEVHKALKVYEQKITESEASHQ